MSSLTKQYSRFLFMHYYYGNLNKFKFLIHTEECRNSWDKTFLSKCRLYTKKKTIMSIILFKSPSQILLYKILMFLPTLWPWHKLFPTKGHEKKHCLTVYFSTLSFYYKLVIHRIFSTK